jgi:CHAD domain-containing protein
MTERAAKPADCTKGRLMTSSRKAALSKDVTAQQALRQIIMTTADDFDGHLNQLMTSDDPEGPHGARIALRRIRSVLSGFSALIDTRVLSEQKDEARCLFRLIGTLRDADVRAEGLASVQARNASQDHLNRIRTDLCAAMTKHHAETYAKRLCTLFQGNVWKREGSKAKHRRKAPMRKIAVRALNRAWSGCHAYGLSIADLSLAKRHALRKELKALRYLSEYFADLWSGKTKENFSKRLRSLQDQLGTLNDIYMIQSTSQPDQSAQERLDETTARALAKSDKDWRKLHKTPLFWN